jgi:Tfp pilus assembly PilM family ATPase
LPRYLALDWDHQLLHIVSANVGRGGVHVQRAAVWRQEQSPNPAEPEALGQALRDRLKEAGIAPAPVLVSVGRDRFILKDVRYPQVPESEEAAVVRFQASKDLTYPSDEVVIDYLPCPGAGPNGERRAQALILRRELLDSYQNLCKAAGLKLAGITPRPFGIAVCAQRSATAAALGAGLPTPPAPETAGGAVAVLTVTDTWAEFCVARGGRLLFTRSLASGTGLVGEIRRNLSLYAGQPQVLSPEDRVQALYVAGNGEHSILREQLQELLAIPVHSLDPFAGVERLELTGPRGGFSGAVGLLHARADAQGLPVNFAQPREARPERDPNRHRYLVAAGLGVLALVVLFVLGQKVLASKKAYLEGLREDGETLDNNLAKLEKDSKNLKQLKSWTGTSPCWLELMADLSHRFPEAPKKVRLKELSGVAGSPAGPGGKKTAARLNLQGEFETSEQHVDQLASRLEQDTLSYLLRIIAKTITPSDPNKKTPGKFTATVEIDKAAPAKGGKQAVHPAGRRQS